MKHIKTKLPGRKSESTFFMTTDEYRTYSSEYMGLCTNCGAEVCEVEPDARNYNCEVCDQKEVFGVDELLIMDQIEIEDEKNE